VFLERTVMQPLKKYICPIIIGLLCTASFVMPASAASFEDGEAAYNQLDYKTAFEVWAPLAEEGNAQAQYKLGMMYDNGFGVKADPRQAVDWYRRAAVQGDKAAERHYEADNFAYSMGLPAVAQTKAADKIVPHKPAVVNAAQPPSKIKPAAENVALQPVQLVVPAVPTAVVRPAVPPDANDIQTLEGSANNDNVQAQLALGNRYALGKDVPQDYEMAAEWYAKAAGQGNAVAEELLGDLYNTGSGVQQDYPKAAQWYRLAAEQGNAHAQEDLGTLYTLGHGVPQDYEQAALWYKKAADQGDAEAQSALAALYGAGLGVPQNYNKAEKLYDQAAAQGNTAAKDERDIIHDNKLDTAPPPKAAVPTKMTVLTQQGLDVGGDISAYQYNETVNEVSFVHHGSNKVGLEGGYTYVVQPVDAFMRAETRYAHGGANYSSAAGIALGQPDNLWDTRVLAGKDFTLGEGFSMSPYAGVGFRYLYNDARGDTNLGIPGYRRESKYRYVPLGSTERYALGEQMRLSLNLEYDLFTGGTQKSYLSDAVPAHGDIMNHQSAGVGARGSLLFETSFAGGLSVGPWFDFWHIKDSDQVAIPGDPGFGLTEPNNKTTELGLKVVKDFW
jgi:TPR repeat protein